MKRIRVTIADKRFIPSIGKGPITSPISITTDQYNLLTQLGYEVVETERVLPKKMQAIPVQEDLEEVVEKTESDHIEKVEEAVSEEDLEEIEDVVEEESEEESEEETSYTKTDLDKMVKKELIEILDARGIEYKPNDTVAVLNFNNFRESVKKKNN
ncbi:hypothetical protein Bp8pS_225 [Bacillus phage vB_BpuM-BpSp]|nr:hypothetical protein Bp8pS_225 [Bacillus phage vB_BpuM-BpSp]